MAELEMTNPVREELERVREAAEKLFGPTSAWIINQYVRSKGKWYVHCVAINDLRPATFDGNKLIGLAEGNSGDTPDSE